MLRKKGSHDYRGRMYPDSDALNAVSEGDLARGLLQFARAEPLGARGRFWLAVHIANCSGRGDECGKLASLNQRAAWTERNGARLLSFMESSLMRYLAQILCPRAVCVGSRPQKNLTVNQRDLYCVRLRRWHGEDTCSRHARARKSDSRSSGVLGGEVGLGRRA
jgi:hypothetical protein